MTFHYIEFKTFCHSTENLEKVKTSMENTAYKELDIETTEAEGYYGNKILILEGKISRNREMDSFFENLPEHIIQELLETLEKRIDERCNFYFRLNKDKAYNEEFSLSEGDNAIKIRARVESYPSKRSSAVEKMEEYLSSMI